MKNDIAFVVLTSDSYSDVWHIFYEMWQKNSGFANYKLYFVSNSLTIKLGNAHFIAVDKGKNMIWSDRILLSIDKIVENNLILLTEDLFFYKKTNIQDFEKVLTDFIELKINYLKLICKPNIRSFFSKKIIPIPPFYIHRISLQMSIWNKMFLKDLLKQNESPWDFEIKGSLRSQFYSNIYTLNYDLVNYVEVISKGKYTKEGYNLIKKFNTNFSTDRPIFTYVEQLKRNFGHFKSFILYLFPQKIYAFLRKLNLVGN